MSDNRIGRLTGLTASELVNLVILAYKIMRRYTMFDLGPGHLTSLCFLIHYVLL